MKYINRFGQGQRETVDQVEDSKEANRLVSEYRLSDSSAQYYVSSRPCKDWDDK